jgi:hypothetical protein
VVQLCGEDPRAELGEVGCLATRPCGGIEDGELARIGVADGGTRDDLGGLVLDHRPALGDGGEPAGVGAGHADRLGHESSGFGRQAGSDELIDSSCLSATARRVTPGAAFPARRTASARAPNRWRASRTIQTG